MKTYLVFSGILFTLCCLNEATAEDSPVLYPLTVPSNPAIGDNAEMHCTLKRGSLPIKFTWLYNGKEINSVLKHRITTAEKSSHFSIGDIQASDIGNYTCVASNRFGQDSKTESVIIEGATAQESPVLYPLMFPSNPSVGDSTEMICSLKRGTLPVKFKWLQDSKEISSVRGYKITTSERRSVLSISDIQASHVGNYTCVVSNFVGSESKTEPIIVEGVTAQESPVLYPLMFPSNPSVGDSTEMICSLKRGTLPVKFKWLHDSKEISSVGGYKITTHERRSVLSISDIQASHVGNYTCVVSNSVGSESKTEPIIVEVYSSGIPVIHPLLMPPDLGLGDSLDISCSLKRGNLPVTFEWIFNGMKLAAKPGVKINTSQRRSGYLIDKISEADIGNYTCRVYNSDGSDEAHAELRVEVTSSGVPVIHPLLIPSDLGLGDGLDIQCSLKRGILPVTFMWKFNEQEANTKPGVKINTSQRRSVYVIDRITEEHIGNYTCTASNSEGFDEARTVLKVEGGLCEKPYIYPVFIPPNVALGDPLDITCSLKKGMLPVQFSWFRNGVRISNIPLINVKLTNGARRSVLTVESVQAENIGNYTCLAVNDFGSDNVSAVVYAEVPPHWSQEPMDTTAAKGSSLLIDCSATGHPAPRVAWSRQKGDRRDPLRNEPQWSAAPNGSLIFPRVDESDAGVYTCEAHNGIGPGIFKSIQLSVHAPPEIKERFQTVTVRRGHTARLICEASGDQQLVVTWRKDNHEVNIHFGTRFEVVRDVTEYSTKSELLIHDSQKTDVGNYICHAHNQFGEDEGKVKLAVIEPPSPPTGLRASEVTKNSMRLSWQPSTTDEGLVENYVVRYWRNDEKRGKLHQFNLPSVKTSVTVSNLHPGTSYSVQVFAQNNVGQGDPSQPITFRTDEEAPSGAPLDLRAEAVSSKAIRVTWKPPQRHNWNGHLRGYYVGHRVAHSTSTYTYQTVETNDRRGGSLLIQGLQKSTSYSIVVKAYNAIGQGPASHEVVIETLEEDPPTPPIVGVADVTSSSVGIHWNIGSDRQPSVVQYLLEFREEGEEWDHIHLPGERSSFYLTGLKGSTRYELRLAAYNVFGRGEFSPTIDFTTGLAEISVPFAATHSNTPFYFRPYFVIPVAASVVVIVTTVVIAWVCYKRMTLRQDRLLAACQPFDSRLMAARASLQGRDGYCEPVRPPSYTPPMSARHPTVGMPDDDAYDAPWDMAAPGPGGNAQAGSYTRLKSQMPNPGGAIVIAHQSGVSR